MMTCLDPEKLVSFDEGRRIAIMKRQQELEEMAKEKKLEPSKEEDRKTDKLLKYDKDVKSTGKLNKGGLFWNTILITFSNIQPVGRNWGRLFVPPATKTDRWMLTSVNGR